MLAGGTCDAAPRSLSTTTGLDHLVGGFPRGDQVQWWSKVIAERHHKFLQPTFYRLLAVVLAKSRIRGLVQSHVEGANQIKMTDASVQAAEDGPAEVLVANQPEHPSSVTDSSLSRA